MAFKRKFNRGDIVKIIEEKVSVYFKRNNPNLLNQEFEVVGYSYDRISNKGYYRLKLNYSGFCLSSDQIKPAKSKELKYIEDNGYSELFI